MDKSNPSRTILICTLNRAKYLEILLNSIYSYSLPKDYEILVVDNGSNDRTEEIVKKYDGVKYILEPIEGLSEARNTGIVHALGQWIIFLDDDCYVDQEFFHELENTIKNYDFDGFTGVYLPWYEEAKPRWLPDSFGKKVSNSEAIGELSSTDYFSGGIMAFKKKNFLEVGDFPTNLGMKGSKIAYGEETYLVKEMKAANLKLGINPRWRMFHLVRPEKYRISWHLKHLYAKGRDEYKIRPKHNILYLLYNATVVTLKSVILKTPQVISSKSYFLQNFIIDVSSQVIINAGRIRSLLSKNH